jgi:hypothetical protein
VKAGRPNLAQQREHQAPFFLEPDTRGDPCALAGVRRQPLYLDPILPESYLIRAFSSA